MQEKNIRILVVENEDRTAECITQILRNCGYVVLAVVKDYDAALASIKGQMPDLILLNPCLDTEKKGIDLAWKIREIYVIPFIFMSSNTDVNIMERAKHTEPAAYLFMPFHENESFMTIETALYNFNKQQTTENKDIYVVKDALFVKENLILQKVLFQDILFLENDHIYIYIHTVTKKIIVRATMEEYIKKFPQQIFFRVHRRFIVNINHIDKLSQVELFIKNHKIPITKAYRIDLLHHFILG